MKTRGLFITFEGSEGAGKSTQIAALCEWLNERCEEVLLTREPGGTGLGEKLRELIKYYDGEDSVCDESELLMFGASRAQLMQRVILPHLEKGGVVICDRFADSTTVYQGLGRGLSLDFIDQMHTFSMAERWPDLTILLDIPVEVSYERIRLRNEGRGDRIEASGKAFFESIRQGFLTLAERYPQRYVVIDGTQTKEDIFKQITLCVEKILAGRKINE